MEHKHICINISPSRGAQISSEHGDFAHTGDNPVNILRCSSVTREGHQNGLYEYVKVDASLRRRSGRQRTDATQGNYAKFCPARWPLARQISYAATEKNSAEQRPRVASAQEEPIRSRTFPLDGVQHADNKELTSLRAVSQHQTFLFLTDILLD